MDRILMLKINAFSLRSSRLLCVLCGLFSFFNRKERKGFRKECKAVFIFYSLFA